MISEFSFICQGFLDESVPPPPFQKRCFVLERQNKTNKQTNINKQTNFEYRKDMHELKLDKLTAL